MPRDAYKTSDFAQRTASCWHTGSFMFHILERRIGEAFAERVASLYGQSVPVQTEQPKQTSFGEIAVPAAFQLARQLKKAPKAIAAELAEAVGRDRGRRGRSKSPATDISTSGWTADTYGAGSAESDAAAREPGGTLERSGTEK